MKNTKSKIAFFSAVAVFLVAVILLLNYLFPSLFKKGPEVVKQPEKIETQSGEKLPENPKNFDALQKINPDIYAWISIPGTLVDYPVLQYQYDKSSGEVNEDQDLNYYIDHDVNKKEKREGSIYSQRLNSKDFSDANTILYGHNMKDDSMFGSLHSYSKADFLKKNPYIYIYTKGHILTYKIYAAYNYDDRHILYSFDFTDPEVTYDYFQMTLNPKTTKRNIDSSVTLTAEDKIITLSTCVSGTHSSQRYLVQGVLIDDVLTQ